MVDENTGGKRAKRLKKAKSPWNSLERAKLIVGALTPAVIGVVGFYATNRLHSMDDQRLANQDRRARMLEVAPLLADLEGQYDDYEGVANAMLFNLQLELKDPGSQDKKLFLEQKFKLHQEFTQYQKHFVEDWERLRPLVDNQNLYMPAYAAAANGLLHRALLLDSCTSDVMLEYANGHGITPKMLTECSAIYDSDASFVCWRGVHAKLEDFTRDVSDAEWDATRRACAAPMAPLTEASAAAR